jgi:hypothetical protein
MTGIMLETIVEIRLAEIRDALNRIARILEENLGPQE